MKRALLVIDAQKVYTTPGWPLFCPDSAGTIVRVNAIIERFRYRASP
jgi:nicotinamidase-related amidase